jgi:hypothetical protein
VCHYPCQLIGPSPTKGPSREGVFSDLPRWDLGRVCQLIIITILIIIIIIIIIIIVIIMTRTMTMTIVLAVPPCLAIRARRLSSPPNMPSARSCALSPSGRRQPPPSHKQSAHSNLMTPSLILVSACVGRRMPDSAPLPSFHVRC